MWNVPRTEELHPNRWARSAEWSSCFSPETVVTVIKAFCGTYSGPIASGAFAKLLDHCSPCVNRCLGSFRQSLDEAFRSFVCGPTMKRWLRIIFDLQLNRFSGFLPTQE